MNSFQYSSHQNKNTNKVNNKINIPPIYSDDNLQTSASLKIDDEFNNITKHKHIL
jgi:hypothetical protein